jgi:hypothetical protein
MACLHCASSDLKAIVSVRMATKNALKETLCRVRQEKQKTPDFVLPDVSPLMSAEPVLFCRTARDNDMAHSNCREGQAIRDSGEPGISG